MRNLKMVLVVALGVALFSSCSTGYGCPYNTFNDSEIVPAPADNIIPEARSSEVYQTSAIAR